VIEKAAPRRLLKCLAVSDIFYRERDAMPYAQNASSGFALASLLSGKMHSG
jgi:hypothetical protein